MQLHPHLGVQPAGSRRCTRRTSTTPSVPIRSWGPAARNCSCKAFAPEAASTSAQQGASSPLSSQDNSTGAGPGGRQTYIQESVSFTGAELAARLPSMQAAMRARAEATAAAVQQRDAGPAAAPNGSSKSWGTSPASSSPAVPRRPSSSAAAPRSSSVYATTSAAAASAGSASVISTTIASPAVIGSRLEATDASTTYSGNSGSTYTNGASSNGSYGYNSTSVQALPSPSNLAGLSASEKLQALQQVQAASRQALQQATSPSSPYYVHAPKTIDVRMYDQLVVAHNKLSKKLGESNAHVDVLEAQMSRVNQDLMAAYELLKQIAMEFGTTSRLAQSTAAAVQFGVDPQDAIDKIGKLQERLSTLEQAVLEQRHVFGQRVVREVPVEWIGVASEVKVMGDFDDWTRGHELSAEDVATDSVYSRFEGKLMLRPGTYRVKFLVDGEWRLAADWPTEDDGEGNTVCVLKVA